MIVDTTENWITHSMSMQLHLNRLTLTPLACKGFVFTTAN